MLSDAVHSETVQGTTTTAATTSDFYVTSPFSWDYSGLMPGIGSPERTSCDCLTRMFYRLDAVLIVRHTVSEH